MNKILSLFFLFVIGFSPIGLYAAVTGLSFGGKYFYSFPCTCTGNTVSYIIVGPPSFLGLTYTIGTQGYSKYLLPQGRQILGLYNPFVNEACWMIAYPSCYVIPAVGHIMPMVGSSI
jgi:hypothetical protein